jgi:short-subunit dehydrogenase
MPEPRRRILLTGASGGIGQALCHALEPESARLFVVGRQLAPLQALAHQYPEGKVVPICGDITNGAVVVKIAQTVSDQGGVDLLINNAGVSTFGSFTEMEGDHIAEMVQTNLLGPLLLTQALLPCLQTKPTAQVINIGSTLGYIGYPGYAGYCASKYGLRGFTEALARELADTTVRVRLFSPRATQTTMNSSAVRAMNQALGVTEDSPRAVADAFVRFLHGSAPDTLLGRSEAFFSRLNQVFPNLVARSLRRQLPAIRSFFSTSSSNHTTKELSP